MSALIRQGGVKAFTDLRLDDEQAARKWGTPFLKHLERGRGARIIHDLKTVSQRLRRARRLRIQCEINYFGTNLDRVNYPQGAKLGEPLSKGGIESTCRQYQFRFKRLGQFWTTVGHKGLKCLETFWRNQRPPTRGWRPFQKLRCAPTQKTTYL